MALMVTSLHRAYVKEPDMTDTPSPVRTRTVTEIVPGTYGPVIVGRHLSPGWVDIRLHAPGHTAPELRAAAKTLLDLADALDAGARAVAPTAPNDGWIDWHGGSTAEPPISLDPGLHIEVRLLSGSNLLGQAGDFNWKKFGDLVDIVAYRVTEPKGTAS